MKNMVNFFDGVRGEFNKVIWPSFDQFVESTVVVLFLVVVFALYTGVVDLGFLHLIHAIFKIYG